MVQPPSTWRSKRLPLEVWRYAEDSARFIFGDSIGDPDADALLHALRDAPSGLTRTEINDALGHHWPAPKIERALAALERLKLAERTLETTAGRSAERWTAVMIKPATTLPTLTSPIPTAPADAAGGAAKEAEEAEDGSGCIRCLAGLACWEHKPKF